MADELKYKRKNPFVILSHNFIKWDMLNWNEKDIYIILLMYADSEQKCFPSINTLCKVSGKSNKTVIRALKGLEEKHLLKKETRITKNGQSSNLYTLYDFESIWEAESIEQVPKIVDTEIKRKQLYELARELNYIVMEEKEPTSAPTKVTDVDQNENSSYMNKDNTKQAKSQELERYTMSDIKMLYEYDSLIVQYPAKQTDIDVVFDILYDTLNSTKQMTRVCGDDKPTMAVIGRLMKLQPDDLIYSIDKYHEQTDRIKNVKGYLLTILYNSREQNHLDIMNLGHHNGDF